MIFSQNQALALEILNLKCYLPKEGAEEILVFAENKTISSAPEFEIKENQNLENLEKLEKLENLERLERKEDKINFDEFRTWAKNDKLEAKLRNNPVVETNNNNEKTIPKKIVEEKLILKYPKDLNVFTNLDTTIILHQNIAFFLPPLVLKDRSYKIYYYEKEIEIWVNSFNYYKLEELAKKFQEVANNDFPAPENREIPQDFKADLAIIFGNNEIRKLSDNLKIPSILCMHPALAASGIEKYRKLFFLKEFKRITEIIKQLMIRISSEK